MLKASRATFILLLMFAPLAFGSVESWSFFVLTLLTGAAFLFYLIHCLMTGHPFYRIPCFLPLLLLASLLLFQLIPLPEAVLGILSPKSLLFRQQTAGLFSVTTAWPVSLDVERGIYELARFLVCCGCFVLTVQLLSDRHFFKRILLGFALFGGALALFSVLQSIFTVDRVLWFREVPENAQSFGPYVNRNHYAGLMEMFFSIALSLTFAYRPSIQFGTRRERIIGFLEDDDFLLFLLLCLSVVFIALSVFMTLSRGGIFSMCVSTLFFIFIIARMGRTSRRLSRIRVAFIVLVALVLAASWFGWDRLDQRFGEFYLTTDGKINIGRQYWEDIPGMIEDFPLFGAGFGSFRNLFPKYLNTDSAGLVDFAHNDYLQLLAEAGIVGLLLFILLFMCLFRTTLRMLKQRVEPYAVFVCLGAMAGLVAIFCHSLVDFNLHINANTLYFSFLCALMLSAVHTRFRPHLSPGTYLHPCQQKIKRVVLAAFIVLWIPLLVFSAGQWAAAYATAPFKHMEIASETDPVVFQRAESAAIRASRLNPFEASYRIMKGDSALAAGEFAESFQAYQQAIVLVPTRSEFLQKAGLAAYYANRDIEQADALMTAGIKFYPAQPVFYGRYAAFLLETGRQVAAAEIIRKGIDLNPYKFNMFLNIMRKAKMTPVEMYAALTDHSFVWERFASYVSQTDYSFMQKEILLKAINAAEREEKPLSKIYLMLARLYAREKRYDEAISVLERGTQKLPDHIGLLYQMAILYEKRQIFYKASELYERILIIKPGHEYARRYFEKLPDKSGNKSKTGH